MGARPVLGRIGQKGLVARLAEREVALGWTVVLVPSVVVLVFVFGSYSGGALPWLGRVGVLARLNVAALAIAGFAAGYASTEPGPGVGGGVRRPLLRRLGGRRVFAIALVFACVFFLRGLATFAADRDSARLAEMVTWWGIPFGLCAWALAAVTISWETEQAGTGKPAAPGREWRWLVGLRERRGLRIAAYVFLFGGTIVFAVVGVIPGVVWDTSRSSTWRGYIGHPVNVWYAAFFVWAGGVAVVSWLYLLHAFRVRPSGLPHADLRRAWYSSWAGGALVAMMGLFVLADQGVLSESVLDLVLALYALVLVLMMVDASAQARHRRVRSSLRRRVVASLGIVGFGFLVPSVIDVSPFRAGLVAACIAGAVPLVPVALRALYGVQRLPPDPLAGLDVVLDPTHFVEPLLANPEDRELLRSILVRGRLP